MNPCAICQKPLTPETDSREHIFPNAVGGKKKVTGFICRDCNSRAGENWDAELSRQLNPISLMLGIARERGTAPSQEFPSTAGQAYVLHADGSLTLPKPVFKETADEKGTSIQITARSMGELKKMLPGLKKKYPQIDEAAFLKAAVIEKRYPKDLLHVSFHFEGPIAGRSVVKTALALAVRSGIDATSCEVACEYLRNDAIEARWVYYPEDPIVNRPKEVALHCVAIQGQEGRLVAYVEYFGFRKMWVLLSEQYEGPAIQAVYAIDPVAGCELSLSVKTLPLATPVSKHTDILKMTESSLANVLGPAIEAANARELERVVREAWSYACEQINLKPGDIITVEHKQQISILMAEKMAPFLEHRLSNPFANFKP